SLQRKLALYGSYSTIASQQFLLECDVLRFWNRSAVVKVQRQVNVNVPNQTRHGDAFPCVRKGTEATRRKGRARRAVPDELAGLRRSDHPPQGVQARFRSSPAKRGPIPFGVIES